MASTTHTPRDARSTGRKVRRALMGLLLAMIVAQFYLAGRGTFRAGSFEPHEILGGVIVLGTLIALIVSLAFADLRSQTDLVLPGVLFVLAALQYALASYETPELAALHPVNGLLITGAVAGILSRDRRLGA